MEPTRAGPISPLVKHPATTSQPWTETFCGRVIPSEGRSTSSSIKNPPKLTAILQWVSLECALVVLVARPSWPRCDPVGKMPAPPLGLRQLRPALTASEYFLPKTPAIRRHPASLLRSCISGATLVRSLSCDRSCRNCPEKSSGHRALMSFATEFGNDSRRCRACEARQAEPAKRRVVRALRSPDYRFCSSKFMSVEPCPGARTSRLC